MKPTTDYGTTITSGTMKTGAATIELTPEMFTLLSDGMYTDKILAPIRESICNARDAQVEADVDQPLDVHLPTRLEPFFHVRDFGGGLSERQVLGYFDEELGEHVPGLYLRYGKSTKRDSNLQIGGFGIGCKSPLAYSDSFIVESYQQGTVKTYTIYKEDGIPNIAMLSEKLTTEDDGLKVKIAVASQDTDAFVQKAADFLKFFNFPINITGQQITYEPKYILQTTQYDTVEVGYGEHGKIKASMGGVVYNVSDKYRQELEQVAKSTMLIMKFDIGDLSVAGSREALSEDANTLAKLDARVELIRKEFYAVMKAKVEDPTQSIHESIEMLRGFDLVRSDWRTHGWVATSGAKDFTLKGEAIEDVLNRFSTAKMRVISRSGSDIKLSLSASREVPAVLDVDRGSGYLKVARRIVDNMTNSGRIILALDDNDMDLLKEYFGEDNLTIEQVSVKYAEFFPKGAPVVGKIKVANSGLFTTNRVEVTEIDEGQVGYYIPFERYTCVMDGLPSRLDDFNLINPVIKSLVNAGKLKDGELFYSRKAGMRAIKKTNLKELTWKDVMLMARKSYTPSDYKEFIREGTNRSGNPATSLHQKLGPFWDAVEHNYPTWANKAKIKSTRGMDFLNSCGIVPNMEPDLEKDQRAMSDKYSEEATQFHEDFPILGAFGTSWWKFTDVQVEDIISFCEWKALELEQSKKNAA